MNEPARLEAVEFKLAHMEHALGTLGTLSDVIARQQREIDAAHERLKHLAERLAGFEGSHSEAQGEGADASAGAFEKPPHY
jgi:uncharacterized coiled-coil protein SlyX